MKKILGILVIAGTMVACNDNSDSTNGGDTTNMNVDTTTNMPPLTVDTTTIGTDTLGGTNTDTTNRQ